MKRLMFYCQHVLGIGHLVRSIELIRELARDFEVTFVMGGSPVEGQPLPAGVHLVQLPALETDACLQELRPCDPTASFEEVCGAREMQLLELFETLLPEVLVIELYPFGRRQFSFELKPLLKRARRTNTLVACSLRDVLVQKPNQAAHEQRVCELANAYFDLILVHGDPAFLTLDKTFSRVSDLECEVRYTGYVAHSAPRLCEVRTDGRPVIVSSIGGGRCEYGWALLKAVIQSAALLRDRLPHEFRIFAGPAIPDGVYQQLAGLAAGRPNIALEKYTPSLASHLEAADLSISLGGYNSVMDLLQARIRALVYPAMPNGDQEQNLRAEKLANAGVIELIPETGLAPERLAAQIERAIEKEPRSVALNLNGAANSRAILRARCRQKDRKVVVLGA
jgi:predicted glycosyltransferase